MNTPDKRKKSEEQPTLRLPSKHSKQKLYNKNTIKNRRNLPDQRYSQQKKPRKDNHITLPSIQNSQTLFPTKSDRKTYQAQKKQFSINLQSQSSNSDEQINAYVNQCEKMLSNFKKLIQYRKVKSQFKKKTRSLNKYDQSMNQGEEKGLYQYSVVPSYITLKIPINSSMPCSSCHHQKKANYFEEPNNISQISESIYKKQRQTEDLSHKIGVYSNDGELALNKNTTIQSEYENKMINQLQTARQKQKELMKFLGKAKNRGKTLKQKIGEFRKKNVAKDHNKNIKG